MSPSGTTTGPMALSTMLNRTGRPAIPKWMAQYVALTDYLPFSPCWVERRPDWSPAALWRTCNVTGRIA
jgi:hypothetical protein